MIVAGTHRRCLPGATGGRDRHRSVHCDAGLKRVVTADPAQAFRRSLAVGDLSIQNLVEYYSGGYAPEPINGLNTST